MANNRTYGYGQGYGMIALLAIIVVAGILFATGKLKIG